MSVKVITKDNFQVEVENSNKTVLIDFWASWCGPCKMLTPILEEVAGEVSEQVLIGKVNVDEQEELATRFQVMSIPTLIAFKDGKVIDKSVGVVSKQRMLEMLSK